jgi:carbon starvation protein
MNQLLACLTFLVLTTWLAKRGKPVIFTAIPMVFLVCTVSWAAVGQLRLFSTDPDTGAFLWDRLGRNWHLILVLLIGLVLEAWMLFEGVSAFRISRRVRRQGLDDQQTRLALAGPSGAVIGADGVIQNPD